MLKMSLEQFVDTLDNVPPELQRNFNLITDLDKRTKDVIEKIHENVKKYKETTRKMERITIRKETDELFNKLRSFADDKIDLSMQTYEMIDKNIQRLTNMQNTEAQNNKTNTQIGFDMPLDSNEPIYCNCRQVSFGEMIACENKECIIEWFHFPCVGITEVPKDKWFCGTCLPLMRKQKSRSKQKKSRRR